MNYRHAYHAGNFADVIKHIVLLELLNCLKRKEKGFFVLDAFSGTGIYDSHSEMAAKSPEYIDGIVRLWDYAAKNKVPDLITQFLDSQAVLTQNNQRYYAGSPFLIANALREQDRAIFNELHKEDNPVLRENIDFVRVYSKCDKMNIEMNDGYSLLKSKLPPAQRRGLVFIDPPFEKPNEFQLILNAVEEGVKRFATGVYCIWYANKNDGQTNKFINQISQLGQPVLDARIYTQNINNDKGLSSTGLVIINPPFGLELILKDVIPLLCKLFKKQESAKYLLKSV